MTKEVFFGAILKVTLGIALVAALIFIPAGTFNYPNGWIFMGILFIPMLIAGFILMFKNPELLRKRLNSKEKEKDQQLVIKLSGLMFVAGFVIAGLNFRFNWFSFPNFIVTLGIILFLLAYLMYEEVLRENSYLSRTVEIQKDQKVITAGLYGFVRHPMYSVTIVLFLSMPLVLNSPISLLIFLIYPCIIAKRISNEEKVLEEGLKGYKEYKKQVKYKIIPFVW